ncbi:MAG: hypothetical protein ACYDBZ_02290 [Steroidobacteraceae bacterium]
MPGNGIRDGVLLGLVLFTLVHNGDALAGEQTIVANPAQDFDAHEPRRSAPPAPATLDTAQLFRVPAATDTQGFSPTEFRPRTHGALDHDLVSPLGDVPMLRGSTVWQRLSEYKSHDRVRLLTLWESSGSTVSLQAGKHGDPSLQWTSNLMNRGGATHGLLDRLFSASLAHAGSSLRNVARPSSTKALKDPASQRASTGSE